MAENDLEEQLAVLRPRLHRYCSRLTGSVFDGEDVLQEALMRAVQGFESETKVVDLEKWVFRIAHNAAIDFLRRKAREDVFRAESDPDTIGDREEDSEDRAEGVAASMAMLMRLSANQRAAVVLKDVMGYRLGDITTILDATLPAVKTALHRGRQLLRELARDGTQIHASPHAMSETERALFDRYVDRFNAYDFDAIRQTLADDVRLDLVGQERREGKRRIAGYFENYAKKPEWRLRVGTLEGRFVILVHGIESSSPPRYCILLEWEGQQLRFIRDFRYARYVFENSECAESFSSPASSFRHPSGTGGVQP